MLVIGRARADPAHALPPVFTLVAAGLYALNMLVGLTAQLWGIGFGRAHHVLYAIVFVSAALATVVEFRVSLLVTVAVLAAFPRARPRTSWHAVLAVLGALGYVPALLA
jgi:hypothetical protein